METSCTKQESLLGCQITSNLNKRQVTVTHPGMTRNTQQEIVGLPQSNAQFFLVLLFIQDALSTSEYALRCSLLKS